MTEVDQPAHEGVSESRSDQTPGLLPLLAVNFMGTLSYSIIMPFLVFLVTQWGGNALIYGLVAATYSVFQLIGATMMGRWSDTMGRKPILLLSQMGSIASWLIAFSAFYLPVTVLLSVDSPHLGKFTLTLPLVVLVLARAIDGLTGGNTSVANAYVADITPPKERSANFGKMAAAFNMGNVTGPALAGLLSGAAMGFQLPVLAAVAFSLAALILVAVGLPSAKPKIMGFDPLAADAQKVLGQEQKHCVAPRSPVKLPSRDVFLLPGMPPILVIYFLVMLAFNVFYVGFPSFVSGDLGWSAFDMGVFYMVMSGLMALVQGPVLARASRICGERTLVLGGAVILASSFLCFVAHTNWIIYLGAVLIALGNGLMWPSVLAMLSTRAGEQEGAAQGLAGSIGAFASILGLLLGGLLFTALHGWLFVLSAALILAVVPLGHWLSRTDS